MDILSRIRIDDIDVPDDTPRTLVDPENIQELARSIEELGLLQPIVVKESGRRYILIAGLSRTLAHRHLGRKDILARILPEDWTDSLAASVVENIQRADLPKLDEARALRELVDKMGWGIPKTARRLGKSEAWVRGRLDLLALPPEMAAMVNAGTLSVAAASELARIPNDAIRDSYARIAAQAGCSAAEAARWRRQVELDIQTGIIDAGTTQHQAPPPNPIRHMIQCDGCEQPIDPATIQILRLCRECYHEITR